MNQPTAAPHTVLGLDPHHTPQASHDWFERAKRVLAGGISSSARATTTGDLPYPLYITRGDGPYIWDADGNQFIDLLLSYGSAILGHADPGLCAAVSHQLRLGTMYGTCNTVEVELAEQICRMYPGAQLVRYANSGSEAIMGAVRAARGFTGKSKILKFEGHYHGWVDVLAVSNRPGAAESGPLSAPLSQPHSRGMPSGVVDDVIICPWNSPDILRDILDRHDGQIAAVIAEPIVANNACIMPQNGYLAFLREQCTRRGIVLIYDEIVTGFRVHSGGAAGLFGVVPDLAVFSKAIGGGLPISAFAGSKPVMDPVAANTVKHGGTYNGNPLCAAAALCTLRSLNDPAVQSRFHSSGHAIMEAVRRAAYDRRIGCIVQGLGSMFQVIFTDDSQPLLHYRDLARADVKRFAAFREALLQRGLFINSSGLACWFISAAHGPDQVLAARSAIDGAMDTIKN
jgi:glutamate-1-semialdehyde 2,1-aminomutase